MAVTTAIVMAVTTAIVMAVTTAIVMAVTAGIVISRHSLPKKMNLPGQTAGSNAPLVKSRGDEGSLSVLIMGLFLITIALLLLMSDVSSIALSKRTLTQATEAAALRAVQSLDKAAYYQGTSAVGVPLDCSMARIRVLEELDLWMSKDEMHRPELSEIRLTDFYCEGNTVDLRTSARVALPFRLPQSTLESVDISASAGASANKSKWSLFG